jgi:monoterpene epsilon-lactone hydrolase
MAWIVLLVLLVVFFSTRYLRGEDLGYLDSNVIPWAEGEASAEHGNVVESITDMVSQITSSPTRHDKLMKLRQYLDEVGDDKEFVSDFLRIDNGSVMGEWVLAPGANPARRILYIHGGSWVAGSPKSHRAITDALSKRIGAAVFSLDYRLMPENNRRAGIEDCRNAYRWILENGPQGCTAADYLVVAGDSAGGNLVLSLLAWVRDRNLRAPDAALAFSPAADVSLTSPSLRSNIASDPMLGPRFGQMAKLPGFILWWSTWITTKIRPCDPIGSPLRGDLSGLPPVLIQVSEAEMLFDDARRYVAKAQAAGSPVVLQQWPFMVHVWQIFTPELPEAEAAFDNIEEFLDSVAGAAAIEQVA